MMRDKPGELTGVNLGGCGAESQEFGPYAIAAGTLGGVVSSRVLEGSPWEP